MPDWFYRPIARKVLFSLPDETARKLALGVIGVLGENAVGRSVIDFMGHMAPDARLAVEVAGIRFASPIGLGWRVDPEQRASAGLTCFGVGCLETYTGHFRDVRRGAGEILTDGAPSGASAPSAGSEMPSLKRYHDDGGREWVRLPDGRNLPVISWDRSADGQGADFAGGVVLQVGHAAEAGAWNVPAIMPDQLAAHVRAWRQSLPAGSPIVVSGGVGGPRDAVALMEAGASLLLIDAGMVFRGPGLVKRCNEALLARLPAVDDARSAVGIFRHSWFWVVALGVALSVGGVAALALALSRVLLPYDEHYLGLTSAMLERTMPRVFAFMSHDRATLAGVMLGLGWLYACLGWHGVRTARHGAKTAVVASALTGFASFFAFFWFGYFDTLHAFVAAVLFQFTVQIMVSAEGGAKGAPAISDDEDRSWRLAQWGQLLWIVHAVGLLLAGALILGIGMTSVFVSEDLGFLCMTAQQAREMGERMMGVIAHDRATLGGMLLASGVATLLPMLWSFRRGECWLWWAMAGLGLPAYGATLWIHWKVGYSDWRHTVPALIGLGLWLGGLMLSRAHLIKRPLQS